MADLLARVQGSDGINAAARMDLLRHKRRIV
jgi:hypothetical protein